MDLRTPKSSILVLFLLAMAALGASCTTDAQGNRTVASNAVPPPTPSNKITAADVAKLKWIEGTWKGMDGEKPFYERYRFEGTTMIVESLDEKGTVKPDETTRFELTAAGEFGPGGKPADQRAGASSVTDTSVQFVPFPGSKGNNYRFEKRTDGQPGWNALLEWPAAPDKPARQKTYNMQPWSPPDKY